MRTALLLTVPLLALAVACGGSYPQPSARLASAEAAARSAHELGAEKDPKAALHLKLAQEQIELAKGMMKEDQNLRADQVLERAGADAELAVGLAKEATIKEETAKAKDKLKEAKGAK